MPVEPTTKPIRINMNSGSRRKTIRWGAACLVVTAIVGGVAYSAKTRGKRPLVPDDKLAMLLAKAARKRATSNPARFDKPAEAMAYFTNKRTGPINTRGANPTVGARPLDPELYRTALAAARNTPYYSTANGSILPPSTNIDVAAGGALGTWSPLGPTNQGG